MYCNKIKEIIAVVIKRPLKEKKNIRLISQKYLKGATNGVESTKTYTEQLELQKSKTKTS